MCENILHVKDGILNVLKSIVFHKWMLKQLCRDFLGGSVVKNPAGDDGSIPGPGRSCMPRGNEACGSQLLSLCSRAQEPQVLRPMSHKS